MNLKSPSPLSQTFFYANSEYSVIFLIRGEPHSQVPLNFEVKAQARVKQGKQLPLGPVGGLPKTSRTGLKPTSDKTGKTGRFFYLTGQQSTGSREQGGGGRLGTWYANEKALNTRDCVVRTRRWAWGMESGLPRDQPRTKIAVLIYHHL